VCSSDLIIIRNADQIDSPALNRLAELDSQVLPAGNLIVASVDDEIVAAFDPATSRSVADPFRPTADVVELLRVRARLQAGAHRRFPGRRLTRRP